MCRSQNKILLFNIFVNKPSIKYSDETVVTGSAKFGNIISFQN